MNDFPVVAIENCVGCAYCKMNCPYNCIKVETVCVIDTNCCTRCLTCLKVCPVKAITIMT